MLVLFLPPKDLYGSASPASPKEGLDVTTPEKETDDEKTDLLDDDVVLDHDQTVEKHGSRFLQKFMILGIVVTVILIVLRSRHNARGRFTKSMV